MKYNLSIIATISLLAITIMMISSSSHGTILQTAKGQSNTMQGEGSMGSFNNGMANTMQDTSDINGTVSIFSPIIDLYRSKIQVSLIDALQSSVNSVGLNSSVIAAFLHPEGGYLVYKIYVLDQGNNAHKILVDVGNGEILSTHQISFMEMMMEFHGNDMMMSKHQQGMMDHDMMTPGKGIGDPMAGYKSGDMIGKGPMMGPFQ